MDWTYVESWDGISNRVVAALDVHNFWTVFLKEQPSPIDTVLGQPKGVLDQDLMVCVNF